MLQDPADVAAHFGQSGQAEQHALGLSLRTGRRAEVAFASGNVLGHARAGAEQGTVADVHMVGNAHLPGQYAVLGTDGFGRSDSRAELRRFFEVDRHYVVIAALKALADEGKIDMQTVSKAMQAFGIDPEKSNPLSV